MNLLKRITSTDEQEHRFQDAIRVTMGLLNWLLPETERAARDQED